ncbi:MAG: glycine--tRNA ligase [Candidatus Omnitrophota bacterium]
MEKIISLCKRRGFIFQGSEIYGGLANTWDYGPLGVELKNNVKRAWWKASIYDRFDMYGLDSAILMHPKTWEASGHTKNFSDILVDCKTCKKRLRADKIKGICPECGGKEFTEGRPFNLMFKTEIGVVSDATSIAYLRPETAQGIFVNFLNILDSMHPKLPFGIAQIGKSFRNEITPGNYTFRTREFEQMEIEYFVKPEAAEKYYNEWIESRFNWYTSLGIKKENLRIRPHEKNELAHYALACSDIEYKFPFEGGDWQELEGIANRTDFDLKQHSEFSGKKLEYFDEATKERFLPYIIEPSGGVDRATLAFLVDAYCEEEVKEATRVVLKLHHKLSPYKIAVFPLLKNRPQVVELAKKIALDLKKYFITIYDDTGAIGKLYRRQDEIGTPFCVTVDVQSTEDQKVTIRNRDTMLQDRIDINNLKKYFEEKIII